jgi:hypothetical protein
MTTDKEWNWLELWWHVHVRWPVHHRFQLSYQWLAWRLPREFAVCVLARAAVVAQERTGKRSDDLTFPEMFDAIWLRQ